MKDLNVLGAAQRMDSIFQTAANQTYCDLLHISSCWEIRPTWKELVPEFILLFDICTFTVSKMIKKREVMWSQHEQQTKDNQNGVK